MVKRKKKSARGFATLTGYALETEGAFLKAVAHMMVLYAEDCGLSRIEAEELAVPWIKNVHKVRGSISKMTFSELTQYIRERTKKRRVRKI